MSRDAALVARRCGGSPGRRYRQRLMARLEQSFVYDWPGKQDSEFEDQPPVVENGREVLTLTVQDFPELANRADVRIWRTQETKVWQFNIDDVQVAVERLTARSIALGSWCDWTLTKPKDAFRFLVDLLYCHEWGERLTRTACGLTIEPWVFMEPEDDLPPRRGFPPCHDCVKASWGFRSVVHPQLIRDNSRRERQPGPYRPQCRRFPEPEQARAPDRGR